MLNSVLPPAYVMWILSTYNTITYIVDRLCFTTKKAYCALQDAFTPKTYILFSGHPTAYLESAVSVDASTSAKPLWYYTPENGHFVEYTDGSSAQVLEKTSPSIHTLPVLSMEIVENSNVVYDLTDFAEAARVYNATSAVSSPSIAHIMSAWSASSGIVLSSTRPFKLRLVDTAANTVETEIDSADVLDNVISEATAADTPVAETNDTEPNPVLGSADIKAAFDSGCQGCDKLLKLLATVAADVPKDAAAEAETDDTEPNPVLGSADIKAAFDSGC